MSGKRPEIMHTRFRYEWEYLIDQCVFNEEHRKVLKLFLLDGKTAQSIAESDDITVNSLTGVWDIINKGESVIFAEAEKRPSDRQKTE